MTHGAGSSSGEGAFVGRVAELEAFRAWLGSREPAVLNVSGPGGVGKSALLAAFARDAAAAGRPVVRVDGRVVVPTRDAFLAALGPSTLTELASSRSLVLIDAFEALGGLTRFVREELVPALGSEVRLVVAGRRPLGAVWRGGEQWPVTVRPLALGRLGPQESRLYLSRRGVDDPALVEQILASCGGWPLALSLAADLVEQFGIRRFSRAPEWRLAVRALVEQLLEEAEDDLRALLEAGAVVRQFDEALLAALTGVADAGDAFARLCTLSVVRPTEQGLALHDDLRRLVSDDLRWRRPDRHVELRTRALDVLAKRARGAPEEERGRLLAERLFLWEHEVVRSVLFVGDEPGEVWMEPARPEDREELLALHRLWQTAVRPALGMTVPDAPWDADAHFAWFARLVADPAARVRIARDRTAEAVGYCVVLPLCDATLDLARDHEVIRGTVDAYLRLPVPPLRAGWEEADVSVIAHLGVSGRHPEATRAALLRDQLAVLTGGGAVLCSLDLDEYVRLAEALGYRPIPGSTVFFRGSDYRGYALDLRRVGVEPWLQNLLAGGPPLPLGPGELERELQAVLSSWYDGRALAASTLGPLAGDGPDAIRSLVQAALARARDTCAPAQEIALRAVELAYLERATSHERVAHELHVSRATFYRLLHRGVTLIADAVAEVETPVRLR